MIDKKFIIWFTVIPFTIYLVLLRDPVAGLTGVIEEREFCLVTGIMTGLLPENESSKLNGVPDILNGDVILWWKDDL